ncbi:hypothetical protein X975_21044, partial [Stegodyphus mimosarum]
MKHMPCLFQHCHSFDCMPCPLPKKKVCAQFLIY